jgi:hypothetical protein
MLLRRLARGGLALVGGQRMADPYEVALNVDKQRWLWERRAFDGFQGILHLD